jgi:hypothetical protein
MKRNIVELGRASKLTQGILERNPEPPPGGPLLKDPLP